jgi:DNA-binding response OmpR family regulator
MSAVIGMRILLVEDEPAVQETRADVLRDHGYTVDLAGTLKPRTALGRRPVI